MIVLRCVVWSSVFLLSACAGAGYANKPSKAETAPAYATDERTVPGCAAGENAFDCDRRAILAMLGEFQVGFSFDETVVLAPGYARKPEKRSGGFETVVLVEDQGRRISLQHILVVGKGMVVKHWRQDWLYEAPSHWVFAGDQRFEHKAREPASVAGTWTQLVYEVDDAPRYAGSGRWNHRYGVSTWTSDRTWRPLPRREYTTRSDYQLLNAENRHTITPQGWTHEQDNTKVVRGADGKETVLVREFGFNDYRRITGFDFGPGLAYWKDTAPYWADVRRRWDALLSDGNGLILAFPTGDERLINAILDQAQAYREEPDLDAQTAVLDAAFQRFVRRAPGRAVAGH